jgi:hypothetical protein
MTPGIGGGGGTMGVMVAVVYCCEPGGVGAVGSPCGAGDEGYEGRVSGRERIGVGAGECTACAACAGCPELPFVYGVLYCACGAARFV